LSSTSGKEKVAEECVQLGEHCRQHSWAGESDVEVSFSVPKLLSLATIDIIHYDNVVFISLVATGT
jgi:hypothetical protein